METIHGIEIGQTDLTNYETDNKSLNKTEGAESKDSAPSYNINIIIESNLPTLFE